MCGRTLPYFHGVQEHLLNMHSDNIDVVKLIGDNMHSDDTDIVGFSGDNKTYSNLQDKEKHYTLQNIVWNYFQKTTEEECICNLCQKVLLTHEFLVLQAHLLEVHSDNLSVTFDMNPRKIKSLVWKYARRVNEFKIMCDLCGKLCSCNQRIRDHILNMHRDNYNAMKDLDAQKPIERSEKDPMFPNNLYVPRVTNKKSPVWKYCQKVDSSYSKCIICNRLLSTQGGTTKVLNNHLKTKHFDDANVLDCIESAEISAVERKMEKEKEKEEDFKKKDEEKSVIFSMWKFVNQLDWRTVKCVICDTILTPKQGSNSITGGRIKSHLLKFHKDNSEVMEERRKCLIRTKKLDFIETVIRKPESKDISISIWDHFEKDQMNLYAKCKVCQYSVFKLQNGESPELMNHIVTKHPDILV